MKVFRTIQTNLDLSGIFADRISLGHHEWEHFAGYTLYFLLTFLYIVNVAETSREYLESISKVPVVIIILFAYLSNRFGSQTLFKIIHDLEHAINKSE